MADLVVVESPTKVKTIKRILGKGFDVKATVGHIKDLPKNDLGVDLKNFSPKYEIIPGKGRIIKELRVSSRKADRILIATDPDREGEAIAWHVKEEIGDGKECLRVLINEITRRGVEEAIKNPGPLDPNRFSAQKARRVLDRLVGYLISPLLWDKVKRGLSAGRVQSVAVRLICEREKEIREFVPEDFWEVHAKFLVGDFRVEAKLDGKLKSEAEARDILEKARGIRFVVSGSRKKEVRGPLVPPFITSTLQQEAYRRFGFSPKKTMLLAQRLYEGVDVEGKGTVGLITYMRTDSVRLSDEAVARARKLIKTLFGEEFLPARKNVFKNKKSSQDAHEAIRPAIPEITPEELRGKIDPDLHRLYELIWKRFVASQMLPPRYEELTFDIVGGSLVFKVRLRRMVFQGYRRLYGDGGDGSGREFPGVSDGMGAVLEDIRMEKKTTEPPKRYTVGTLIKALEEKGIGRPSTYATIVSTIQERGYVVLEGGYLKPTFLGEVVTDLLVKHFPTIMDVGFTAKMEERLDEVEEGKERWVDMVRDFYRVLEKDLERARELMEDLKREGLETHLKCRLCGSKMVVRFGKNGPFLLCSRYPDCAGRGELDINDEGEVVFKDVSGRVCKVCGYPMVERKGKFGRFLACSRYPECEYTEPFPIGFECPECGADVVERSTGKGKVFYSCSRYPECSFSSWYLPVGRKCPECGSKYMVLRKSPRGRSYLQCPVCKKTLPLGSGKVKSSA